MLIVSFRVELQSCNTGFVILCYKISLRRNKEIILTLPHNIQLHEYHICFKGRCGGCQQMDNCEAKGFYVN